MGMVSVMKSVASMEDCTIGPRRDREIWPPDAPVWPSTRSEVPSSALPYSSHAVLAQVDRAYAPFSPLFQLDDQPPDDLLA